MSDDLNSNISPESAQSAQESTQNTAPSIEDVQRAWDWLHNGKHRTFQEVDAEEAQKRKKSEESKHDNRSLNDSTLSGMRDRSMTLADYGLRPSHKH